MAESLAEHARHDADCFQCVLPGNATRRWRSSWRRTKRCARCRSLRAWSRGPATTCTRTSVTGQHAHRRATTASSTATTPGSRSVSTGRAQRGQRVSHHRHEGRDARHLLGGLRCAQLGRVGEPRRFLRGRPGRSGSRVRQTQCR